jgi:hypothetical protein
MVDLTKWRLGYGIGFALYRSGDDLFVGHDGAHAGYLGHVSAFPPKRTGAAVLTNDGAGVTISALGIELSRAVADAFRPVKAEWRPGEAAPPELEGVLGQWFSEGHPIVFSYRGGKLESVFPGARLDLGRSRLPSVVRTRCPVGRWFRILFGDGLQDRASPRRAPHIREEPPGPRRPSALDGLR